jgi:RNA polymerase sigma-70 factor (ECF subfamily)
MARDDIRLVERIRQGDRRAFEEFLDAYGNGVHRLVRRYVDNATDAEDVTQEVFVDLFRCLGSFRGASALSTFVYRVAVNRCLKLARRADPAGVPLDDPDLVDDGEGGEDPARSAARTELSDQVHDAIEALSPGHRDVVVLHEMHGLTYRQCASALNLPVGTVKSRLSNAFVRLRASLRDYVMEDRPAGCSAALKEVSR